MVLAVLDMYPGPGTDQCVVVSHYPVHQICGAAIVLPDGDYRANPSATATRVCLNDKLITRFWIHRASLVRCQ